MRKPIGLRLKGSKLEPDCASQPVVPRSYVGLLLSCDIVNRDIEDK